MVQSFLRTSLVAAAIALISCSPDPNAITKRVDLGSTVQSTLDSRLAVRDSRIVIRASGPILWLKQRLAFAGANTPPLASPELHHYDNAEEASEAVTSYFEPLGVFNRPDAAQHWLVDNARIQSLRDSDGDPIRDWYRNGLRHVTQPDVYAACVLVVNPTARLVTPSLPADPLHAPFDDPNRYIVPSPGGCAVASANEYAVISLALIKREALSAPQKEPCPSNALPFDLDEIDDGFAPGSCKATLPGIVPGWKVRSPEGRGSVGPGFGLYVPAFSKRVADSGEPSGRSAATTVIDYGGSVQFTLPRLGEVDTLTLVVGRSYVEASRPEGCQQPAIIAAAGLPHALEQLRDHRFLVVTVAGDSPDSPSVVLLLESALYTVR